MPHLVIKPIPLGNGKKLEAGIIVDADNWRNRKTLELGRYIRPVEVGSPSDAKAPSPVVESEETVEEPKPEVVEVAKRVEQPKKRVGRPVKAEKKKD